MFRPDIVEKIARNNEQTLVLLRSIENSLQKRFWEMHDPILALLLSVASSEPLLLVGKPGTAKSRLIRAFCEIVGLIDEKDNTKNGPLSDYLSQIEVGQIGKDRVKDVTGYFEYLLTPFTEPNELFGFYNIEHLVKPSATGMNGKLERIEYRMIQNAYVVYLDEVFNASSAILNSLLAFLNERIFHDRGERKRVLYKALFAATNHVPESGELAAVFDRFLLRCQMDNVKADQPTIKSLLEKGWPETYGQPLPGISQPQSWGDQDISRRTPANVASVSLKEFATYQNLFQGLEQLRETLRANSRASLTPNPVYVRQTEQSFYLQFIKNINIARTGGFSEMSNRRVIKMLYVMLIHCMYRSVNGVGPLFELGVPEIELMQKFFYDRAYQPLTWK